MSLFLTAANGQNTARAPIWIMRQAGRYLPEYRAIKEKSNFWEMCRTPELACEITLQPIQRFGLDAAILFQDIMTPLPPMGVKIDFKPGPVFEEPIRSAAAIDALRVPEQGEIAPYVAEADQADSQGLEHTPHRFRRRAAHAGDLHDSGRRQQGL